jgi:hypothetical protein
MSWHDLLFLHWPVEPDALRPHIPDRLAIDTFDGSAWLGVVPFRMSGVRPRFAPALPGVSAFPELNLRTYVTAGERAGVWFFSLEVTSRLAVLLARGAFHLPYFRARMRMQHEGDRISYSSTTRARVLSVGPPSSSLASTEGREASFGRIRALSIPGSPNGTASIQRTDGARCFEGRSTTNPGRSSGPSSRSRKTPSLRQSASRRGQTGLWLISHASQKWWLGLFEAWNEDAQESATEV